MTTIETVRTIGELLARLIKLSKDRETSLLIQQIQEHQLVLNHQLMVSGTRIAELESENRKLKAQIDEESGPRHPGIHGRGF